jgi:hypothetical protein
MEARVDLEDKDALQPALDRREETSCPTPISRDRY